MEEVYKEGFLMKRQRGLRASDAQRKSLKFQKRFFRLTKDSLDYYEKKSLKGQFALDRIKIVEEAIPKDFRKDNCFQVGDNAEVMYFAASSKEERDEWMEAFRKAASDKGNEMLSYYHAGVYGLVYKKRWSCCGLQRMAPGCSTTSVLNESKDTLCTPHRAVSLYGKTKKKMVPDSHRQSLPVELWLCQSQPSSYCLQSSESTNESDFDFFLGQSSTSDSSDAKQRVVDPKSETLLECDEESRLQQIAEEKVSNLNSCHWHSQLSVATAISADSGFKDSSAAGSRQSSQSVNRIESTIPHDSKSVHSFVSDLGIVRDASLNSLNSSVIQLKQNEVDWDSRSERLPQNLKSTASQHTDEDLLYADSEEEVELSDELEELSLASTPLSPLFSALVNDHYLDFKSLLEKGGDPNEVEPATKASLLHWAAEKGCTDAVKLLVRFKANIDIKDDCGATPLLRACKKGHIDVVTILLDSGAKVNEEAANGRTPLHEASVVGDGEIVELLIQKEADVLSRDDSGFTPYQLAFRKGYKDVMEILLQYIPTVAHPYDLLGSTSPSSSQTITTLVFQDSKLISGSKDCNVSVYNSVDLTLSESIPLSNTVLAVDVWGHYLAVGSTTVQTFDSKKEKSHTLDGNSDTLHFVAFGFDGHLATASVEGNEAKLWMPVGSEEKDEMEWKYDSTITVGTTPACISSLSVSRNSSQPWLAIGVQPGSKFSPAGNKLVCLFDWSKRKPVHEFDTGHGGLAVDVYTDVSPDGREVAIGCGDELGVWETETGAQVEDFSSRITAPDTQVDVYVSSLCFSPDGTHLAAGLSTGEVQVFERCSGNSLFNISSPESSSPATSIAYSPNGKLFAAGYQNGVLQLWKAYAGRSSNCHQAAPNEIPQDQKPHFLEQVKLHKKPLLTRTQQLEFNSDGGTYHSQDDGYSLTVPKGAIPENMGSVSVQCGVIPYGPLGPFKYPDGVKPVSPIVWFCSTPNVEFQKPVEIVIPHCLDCQSEEDTQSLAFFKANHDDYTASDSGQKMFSFRKAEGTASFPLSTSSGTLCSKHFCFFCVGVYSREDTAHANFCLITAKPVHIQRRCRLHFCLTYFLATCLKAVEEQFGADYDLTVKKRMKFQVTTKCADPTLKIKFERNLPGRWSIKRESMGKEICASEVYFWDNLPHELELMHEQKMYPPRFTLQVCGEKATHDATAVVEFEGACEDLSTEIHLSLPTTEVQPYNHIGSSQLQALDSGMETTHFHGYPAHGELMDGPYTPGHFAVPRSSGYGNGYSFNVTPPTLSWGGANSTALLQSSPQCFPNMYPTFQPRQMLPTSLCGHSDHMWSHEPPSDVDIEEVTKEVMGKLRDDWVVLQSYLGIPEHVMYQIKHENCERNKIRAMLKEWRNMSRGSRAELAECLQKADPRLHRAAELLMSPPDFVGSNGDLDNWQTQR